jgi:nucleotide-binding universal stress UspA family protein/copper chaperone CopZ
VGLAITSAAIPATQRAGLQLAGLQCGACAGLIEQAVRAVDGAGTCCVNAATHAASVAWDPARTTLDALVGAIRRAGYDAAPDMPAPAHALRRRESRAALWRLFVAGFCMMQVMMLATPHYVARPGTLAPDLKQLLDWGAWVLTLPVLWWSAAPFFQGAWRSQRRVNWKQSMKILLGVDDNPCTSHMFDCLAAHAAWLEPWHEYTTFQVLAPLSNGPAALLTREQVDVRYADATREIFSVLSQALNRLPGHAARSHSIGDLGTLLARRAAEDGFDIVMVGSHGRGSIAQLVAGSTVTRLLAHATTPVLVMR